tara:strand:- start:41222 stop:42403 length:1182 start_codon:yes stop_codon:yes gene_type:complete
MKDVNLVILAGGIGSRIKNYLKNKPKPMAEFNGKSLLQYIIQCYTKYDFNNIYILTGFRSKIIINKFDGKIFNFVPIKCLKEKKRMGTGGALNLIKKKIKKDFILINGDTILDINPKILINSCSNNSYGSMALVKNISYKKNKKLNNLDLINSRISYSKKSKLMNGGVYFFKRKIFSLIKRNNFSLEDELLPKLIEKKLICGCYSKDFFIDIGTPKNFLSASNKLLKNFKRPAAFLDRDGVINYDYGYVNNIKKFKLRPGVIKALSLLKRKKYYIFLVTNQAGIGKGIFTEKQFTKLHKILKIKFNKKEVYFDSVSYSPWHPKAKIKKYRKKSLFRKPGNLMIKKIISNWDINLKKSFMIGDKKTDFICAKNSKLYFEYAKDNLFFQIKDIVN